MPDVSRSDSQRSDASLRPRVSFNRDVHVKRIVPAREASRPVVAALSSDGDGHLISSTVRKERIKKSKKELAEEAAQVIQQADKLNCFTHSDRHYSGGSPEKFYTLPNRRNKNKQVNYPSASLDRKKKVKDNNNSPQKPPRTFSLTKTINNRNKSDPGGVKLKRSASDATHLKRGGVRPLYETNNDVNNKKQLSPIIENIQREDYFQNGVTNSDDDEKENTSSSVTTQLKKYIEEVDRQLVEDAAVQKKNDKKVVVIDIDSAEKISPSHLSKLKKRFKSLSASSTKKPSLVDSAKANLQKPPASAMIHSSQKPADRLPLTKSRTVDRMIRRLNQDAYSPSTAPPVTLQHNNNQPFSYTRGLSPDKSSPPVIYAQVVCNNNNNKQTVHTVYKSPQHHSDSDEGLGNEDSLVMMRKARSEKTLTHFGDSESPIKPKYRVLGSSFECLDNFQEQRGRGDGMDAIRRRESLSEDVADHPHEINVSARRDLLESRITKRIHHNSNTFGYEPKSFESTTGDESITPKTYYKYETSHRKLSNNVHKSTPDIVQQYNTEWTMNGYHDSGNKPEKDRFGDSGIENDIRRDSRDFKNNNTSHTTSSRRYYSCNDSEDEGFASSLLIASERQHTEDNFNSRNKVHGYSRRKEYDSDRAYSAEDDPYRNIERLDYKNGRDYGNVHRERSIDDGSHYDPRIDSKEFRVSTLKRSETKKPPKPEKKSGLQKVKRLFTRSSDSKKKSKENKPSSPGASSDMVREGTLRARYTEYKGSRENLVEAEPRSKREVHENLAEHRYASRRRLSTPSPSSSPTRELEPKRKSDSLQTSWFKSLDRLSRKKNKKENAKPEPSNKPARSEKSLRFFGDTDQDSSDSARHSSTLLRHRISSRDRIRSQSSRELHNISEENNANSKNNSRNHLVKRNNHHKSMTNIADEHNHHQQSRTRTMPRSSLKPPMSPSAVRRNNVSPVQEKFRKKKYEISSVESSTEGDSSQQSQRSVVYLHAATVGDIPGPVHLKHAKRTGSRDELHESSGRIQPQIKTLSRSFSVLAPWKPRHTHETTNIDYSATPTLKKQHQQAAKTGRRSGTLRKAGNSKENLSKSGEGQKSSTLYKKKGRLPRENSRYNKDSGGGKDAESKKMKSMSVESLRSNGRSSDRVGSHEHKRATDISRSISMPKDPEKSAGWFKNNNVINNNKKKSHHRSDYITQRL